MSTSTARWQHALLVPVCALALLTAYEGTRAVEAGRRLSEVMAAAVPVLGDTSALFAKLSAAASRYGLSPDPTAREVLRHRSEEVERQLSVFESNDITGIAGASPDGVVILARFGAGVQTLRAILREADEPIDATRLLAALSDVEGSAAMVSAVVDHDARRTLNGVERELNTSLQLALAGSTGLLALGLGAIVVLMRRNAHANTVARRDVLTGLPNRLTFTETLAVRTADRDSGNEMALMLLDVDLFKNVNDSFGHAAGDALLRAIARRFDDLPRTGTMVSRLGGDEFAILLVGRSAFREASNMAGRIAELLAEPFTLEGKMVPVSMSIGIASTPAGWSDGDTLLKNADLALYAAKTAGRGTFRFFNPRMEQEFKARRDLEDDLRRALAEDRLELHFQPILDLATQRIVSCEALVRWRHPTLGFVPPLRFIGLAEEIGLIATIGDWIIERACATAATWPSDVRVSINLSSHQFDGSHLVDTLTRVLADTGLPAQRIELEITETVLLRDDDHVQRVLEELKGLGASIALDDFGTGYSSLSYLQRFPIDKIKLDQSFVREMSAKPEAAAIVESIGLLARRLGIRTTAEGIETEAHALVLRALGYVEGQGYVFDRPLTTDVILERLTAQTDRAQHRDAEAAAA